jgi:hypothetical protein
MYPFSLLPIIHAANAGNQQDFYREFDISYHPQYSYTPTAWATRPNGGISNAFAYVPGGGSLSGGTTHNIDKLGKMDCTNAAIVFGDVLGNDGAGAQMNLWSCALYLNLTHDFRSSKLAPTSREWVLGNKSDTSIGTSTQVAEFLSTCLAAWCDNEEGCGKTKCRVGQMTIAGSGNSSEGDFGGKRLNAAELDTCLDSICGIQFNSSPDIAGIGVMTSIFIQLVLTLTLPFFLSLCHLRIHQLTERNERRKPHTENAHVSVTDKTVVLRKIAAWERLRQSVLSTLDDFQRAQCCFAIAIDIASLITLYSGRERVTRIDRNAITLATFAGTLPTLVVFCALLLSKERGLAYIIYLTCFTWLLSLITGYLPLTSLTRDIGEAAHSYISAQPSECGGMSPMHVCKEWGIESSVSELSWIVSISSGLTLIFVFLHYLFPLAQTLYNSHLPKGWRDNVLKRLPKPVGRNWDHYVPRRLRPWDIRQGLRALVYIAMIQGIVNCGLYVCMILKYIGNGEMNNEWGFGQVVAVAVWMPTIMTATRSCVWGSGIR